MISKEQKTMKNLFLFLFFLTIFSGCVTRKACDRKFPDKEKDSVSVVSTTVTVIRDTTIYIQIPGDTVYTSVPVSNNELSILNTSMATSEAWIRDGKLNHRLEQKDTVVASTLKGALKTTREVESKKEVTHHTEYINQLTGWQRVQVYLGRFFVLIFVIIILWKLLNIFILK